MMKGKLARKAAKNGSSIFIDGNQKISGGVQGEAGYVAAMREWKSAGLVTNDVNIIGALARVKLT